LVLASGHGRYNIAFTPEQAPMSVSRQEKPVAWNHYYKFVTVSLLKQKNGCLTSVLLDWAKIRKYTLGTGWSKTSMAGLGLFDQKSAIAVTMPIVTAFKFCIGHRKNGLLNR
jgi:hypothetical protein